MGRGLLFSMLPAELQTLIAAENQRRGLSYLPLGPGLLGSETVPFTPRHRLELELAGNAWLVGGLPAPAHTFQFLWRLHPLFRRPDGSFPNQRSALGARPSASASAAAREHLAARAIHFPLSVCTLAIRPFLEAALQDRPARTLSDPPPLYQPAPHWLDDLVDYYAHRYGWHYARIMDTPLALLYQWWRAAAIARGDEVIDPVQEKIGDWFARHIEAAPAGRN